MNINASIIDQRISGILEEHDALLPAGSDVNMKKSAAFVLLSMSTVLDVTLEEAGELLTEGEMMLALTGFMSAMLRTVSLPLRFFRENIKSKI